MGKTRFGEIVSTINARVKKYSQRIKQYEQLNKAMPIIIVFILFSFLHLFSIIVSCAGSFFYLGFSFKHDSLLTEEVVLNVWKYHPDIEDIYTLQEVVLYNANKNGLGTVKILSSEGVQRLPEMVIRSTVIFSVILFICSVLFFLIRITKRGFMKRVIMIFRSLLALLLSILFLFSVSFLGRYHADNYNVQAWTQYELELLSSGAPAKSDIDIETAKKGEVSEWIDHRNNHFHVNLEVGSMGFSISFVDHQLEFHADRTTSYY